MQENNKSYIIFLKRLCILLLLVIVADILLGKLLEHFYFNMKSGQTARITYAITKAKEELIIFGSSRANHNYVPGILEDSMGLSAYNAGIDGQGIPYHYSVFKSIRQRSIPKMIILDINADEFEKSGFGYDRLYVLLPYYYSHKEIQPIVNLRSKYEPIKSLSSLYRYNSFILPVVLNNAMSRADNSVKGYVPLYNNLKLPVTPLKLEGGGELDTVKINLFRSFIKEAMSSNCKVFVFVSPVYMDHSLVTPTITTAENICKEEAVSFMNHSEVSLLKGHPEYFQDMVHLNNAGAEIYTRIISSEIKNNFTPKR